MERIISSAIVISVLSCVWLSAPLHASDELYDAPGLNPYRETLSSIPNEHIDPFTGGVILSFEDFRLPGNGGLDLVIQRTFNSKSTCNQWTNLNGWYCSRNDDNTWLGFGWTLHFGRLYISNYQTVPHIVEMPDGSRHAAYHHISGSDFITKDYWIVDADANPPFVTLANGTKIYYGQSGAPHPDYPNHFAHLATEIRDVNGNTIYIHYTAIGSNIISYVTDSLGRVITFYTSTINNARKLTSITGPGCAGQSDHSQNCLRIDYIHQSLPTSGWTMLTRAQLPVGNPWQYTYDQTLFDLIGLTTPSGGTISYAYDFVNVNMGFSFTYRAVTQKATGGTVPPGRWMFAYSQGTYKDYTQINDPCGRTIKYTYYGYGSQLGNGSMWKLGLPKSKEIVGEETTNYNWTNSQYISPDDYNVPYIGNDQFIHVPYLIQKSITRDGKTYTTNYGAYDHYGNPTSISESGDKTRNRTISYWYNTSKNIVQNKPSSETVSGSFSGNFTTNYSYDTNTGNLLQLNKYGVITSYAYYPNGNLQTVRDANQHTTTYGWTNGRISSIVYPLYTVTRVINDDGTVASERNGRGKITNFTYDGNRRLLTIDPPLGNRTYFTYPPGDAYKKEMRGQYYIYYNYDGFGRPTGTNDIKGIATNIIYNACGPKNYTTSNIGDTVYYDHFGRIEQIVHQDNHDVNYYYSNSDVTVTDEAQNNTYLTYNAFGNPDEKLLLSVRDAISNTTTYNYNILGSLSSVKQGSMTRSFNYDSRNFLVSESHLEKGTTTYGRDNIGNITSKTDGKSTKTYTYDALNRLIGIGPVNITFSYDDANNRTSMVNSSAKISYTYDDSNRLTEKRETVLGMTYTTQYDYDGNDNVTGIDYPLGRHVTYSHNANNQVTSVTGFGGDINNISYYTSGASIGLLRSFVESTGLVTNLSYNTRNFVTDISTGSALHVGYGYDTRGNTTSLTNYLDTPKNQTFGYDNLNRLTSFNGAWCPGYCTGSFTYDSTGNRTSKRVGSSNTSYTYNSSTNRLTATSGEEVFGFSYNLDGDATSMAIAGVPYDLQYDDLHNLTNYNLNGNPIAQFSYDGEGMRVTKTSAGKTIVYHYDKEGRVLSETNRNGNLLADYVYLNGKVCAKIVPTTVPGAPTDVTATPGNAQAAVSFSPPASNGGSAVTSYTVTSNPGSVMANGPASPITVTGLTNGTTYTFTVTATNSVGTGPASAPSNAVTPGASPTVPGPPTNVTATAGNAQAAVSFSPPASNGGSVITSYTVTSNPGSVMANGPASPITVTGLTNGTTYTFTVTATNSVGTGPASAPSNAVTPGASPTVPGPPTNVTATAGNAQAAVSFSPPASNGGSAITSYTVTSNPGSVTATGSASPITVTGLVNGTTYNFTVTATNSIGTGPASAPSNAVTPGASPTVPGPPTNVTATAGSAQAAVSFSPPASNGGSAITSYTVTSNPGSVTATGSASPITVTGLVNGTTYNFTVTATNSIGTGPASTSSNSVTPLLGPTISEFPVPTPQSTPWSITAGPDGNLWFTENNVNKIGRITTSGVVTEFPVPTVNSHPMAITAGPDGNLWFTELNGNKIGRITLSGVITEYPVPTVDSGPYGIMAGPDGNLWFTELYGNKIGRITPSGLIAEFPVRTITNLAGITAGPDGNLWFTENSANKIGRITTSGVVTEFPVSTVSSYPIAITGGPDGNLWFTELNGNKIGRITTVGVITEFPVPTANSGLADIKGISPGPDSNLWFTELNGNKIGRITLSGVITEYPIPTDISLPSSITWGADGNLWFTELGGNKIGRVTLPTEAVSTPSIPSGPTDGSTGTSYSYLTGGAVSGLGHSIQYLFDWGDGTNSGWLAVGTASALKTWYTAGTYVVRAQARCATNTSAVSGWSSGLSVTISVGEAVSTPSVPSGAASGSPGSSYSYTTGGSTSGLGHSIQYLFDWGDGTNSGWLAVGTASALKTWYTAGTYVVRAQARCATNTSAVSGWSSGLSVTISVGETVLTPSVPSGAASGSPGSTYSYTTGGSTSSLGHLIQYLFDWGDGTNSGWLAAKTASALKTWYTAGTYVVRAQARCATNTSAVSGWSSGLSVTISVGETVLTPSVPSGAASGSPGSTYSYTTGGSTSSLGHLIQYLFDWGDGTNSGWLAAKTTSALKTWYTAGTYVVRAQARCVTNTSAVSSWSPGLTVNISMETVSTPSTTRGSTKHLAGTSYSYATGGSTSSLGHLIQYLFDWGDGTNSGWLAVGTTSASKAWFTIGTYAVKAKARCATDTLIVSGWSQTLSVMVR